MARCYDCDGKRVFTIDAGDGVCSQCHGDGLEHNVLVALAESLSGNDQNCTQCGGSGKCPTCGGTGEIDD